MERLKCGSDYDTDRIVDILRQAANDIEGGGPVYGWIEASAVPHDDVVKHYVELTYTPKL